MPIIRSPKNIESEDQLRKRREIMYERLAKQQLDWHAKHIAQYLDVLWHWGDGQGGYIVQRLDEIFEDHGYTASRGRLTVSNSAIAKRVMEQCAYRCLSCGDWHDLTLDHIVPQSKGGPTKIFNLQALCRRCNSIKGNFEFDFRP